MFETSGDVLKIVFSVCIAFFTLFVCWGLFYVIATMRNIFKISNDAKKIFDKIEDILNAVKDKIHASSSYLFLIGEALKKILEIISKADGKIGFPYFGKKKKAKKGDKE